MMNDWSVVMTFNLPQEMYVIQSVLEAEGFETQTRDTDMALNGYGVAIGGAKLLVKKEDYEVVVAFLKQSGYLADEMVDDSLFLLPEPKDTTICPFCGSYDIIKGIKGNLLLQFVNKFLALFVPLFRNNYYCKKCWKRWKYIK